MASAPPCLSAGENQHWWLSNKKIVDKYIKEAKLLLATQEQTQIASALKLVDAALVLSPRLELALELRARSLLYLRRFNDVALMLQDLIPSFKMAAEDQDSSSTQLFKEKAKLLSSGDEQPSFKCFPASDLKKKVLAGLQKKSEKDGPWRYLVLGQACCHLGLIEDAMVLLQTGRRLLADAFRRQSICWSEDSFSFSELPLCRHFKSTANHPPPIAPKTENENISQLLSHIKFLFRRKTAAIAALDAGLYSEAIRHFSKILNSRRVAAQGFLAQCYTYRALAYWSAGRSAEAIADCNKTLALDPSCIEALSSRATLFEAIRCFPESLHDLEHLKLLYNSVLRDRKQPGPAWRPQSVPYREIPGKLCSLATKIQELKQKVASGETRNVDYYALIGLRRGCSRSELERAHLLLTLRHKPDKSLSFIDRCEFADSRDMELVRDRAKSSALLLYRLIQKGYTSVMTTILDEEAADKQRKKAAVAAAAAAALQAMQVQQAYEQQAKVAELNSTALTAKEVPNCKAKVENKATASVFQGVFCRDLAAVQNLLTQVGFNRPIAVKYEALIC